jgi:hypothetical protein
MRQVQVSVTVVSQTRNPPLIVLISTVVKTEQQNELGNNASSGLVKEEQNPDYESDDVLREWVLNPRFLTLKT